MKMQKKFRIDYVVLAFMVVLLFCIGIGIYYPVVTYVTPVVAMIASLYLWKFADRMVQKDMSHSKVKTYRSLTMFSIVFIVCFFLIKLYESMNTLTPEQLNATGTARFFLICLSLMVVGNSAPKIPFNRTLGLRLPWTIANEDTWRYAHRIVGNMTIPCLLIMFVAYALNAKDIGMAIGVLLWCFVPAVLSYWYDNREGENIKSKRERILFLFPLTLFLFSLVLYTRLPNDIPMQFSSSGAVNWMMPKQFEIFLIPVIQAALIIYLRSVKKPFFIRITILSLLSITQIVVYLFSM